MLRAGQDAPPTMSRFLTVWDWLCYDNLRDLPLFDLVMVDRTDTQATRGSDTI